MAPSSTRSYRLLSVLLLAAWPLLIVLNPVICCQVCLKETLTLAATTSTPLSFWGSREEGDERYRKIRQQRRHQHPTSFRNTKLLPRRLPIIRHEENGMAQAVFSAPSNARQSGPKPLQRNPAKNLSNTAETSGSFKSLKDFYSSTNYSVDGGPRVTSVLPASPSVSYTTADSKGPVSTRHRYSLRLESIHLALNPRDLLDEENVGNGDSDDESNIPKEEDNELSDPDPTSKAMIATIGIYKNWISPLLPPACRFVPTCSRYGVQAIEEFGPVKGVILTAWRLLRCSPVGGKGYDPPKWPPVPYWYSSY